MSPFVNPYLLLAIANSIALHAVIVYVPFLNEIFSITKLTYDEWMLVFYFAGPVLLVEEILKIVGRAKMRAELAARTAESKKKN